MNATSLTYAVRAMFKKSGTNVGKRKAEQIGFIVKGYGIKPDIFIKRGVVAVETGRHFALYRLV